MKKITLFLFIFILNTLYSHAQSVGDYVFTQSTEIYTPVVGTQVVAFGDDASQDDIPLGFDFNYGGTNYSTFSVSTNGFVRFGGPVEGLGYMNAISLTSEQRPFIAAFWDDNNSGTGTIQYSVSGTAPDRSIEIGWDSISIGGAGNASATDFGSFKMRLFETTGKIEIIYGSTMDSAGNLTASIGLNDLVAFLSITKNGSTATASNTTAYNAINNTQFLLGQKFTFVPGTHCEGIPAPGNTISGAASICANIPFVLSLEHYSGFGATYQWQSSADGIAFEDISNATNNLYNASQTVTTFYQCIVTCDGASTISVPVEVGVKPVNQCFCTPTYTNGSTNGDRIANFSITGTALANNSGNIFGSEYVYYQGQPNYTATLQIGQDYEINITSGTSLQAQNFTVWVDFNDDGIFGSEERIGSTDQMGTNVSVVVPFTLGCNAAVGMHRMRVREARNAVGATIDPCMNYFYGESEDYDITIEDAPICFAPRDLTAGSINPTNAELSWTPPCHQIGYDVHLGFSGSGLPVGEPSDPASNFPLLVTNLTPGTSYEFYVRTVCGVGEFSDWAGPFAFTTLPPPIQNDECNNPVILIPGTTFNEHAVVGSNINASKSINTPNPTCAAFSFGGDVWFSTVVPADGNVTIEVQSSPGSPFADSGMNAFTGTCDNLTVIGCSDDEGIGSFSKLSLTGRTPGETIYARVWEFGNNVHGAFQISAWNPTLGNTSFNPSSFKYYPNPVKDYLNLSYAESISKVLIYNMLGQEMMVQNPNTVDAKLNLSALPTGSYLVKIFSSNLQHTIKINKE